MSRATTTRKDAFALAVDTYQKGVEQRYGPECFTIRTAKKERVYPYKLMAHYYSRGPMGYGMGKLEIIEHDGAGNLRFEERPYVVRVDQAYVKLGTVGRTVGK